MAGKSITASREEYLLHDVSLWRRDYFDDAAGGYVVADLRRIVRSQINKQETAKFNKEWAMCMVFAKNGYRMEMLNEVPGMASPDVKINGVFGELKRLASHNNIVKEAKKATRRQGADVVLFQLDNERCSTQRNRGIKK